MGLQDRFLEAPSLEAWPGSPENPWRILEALNGGPLDALEASGGGPQAPKAPGSLWRPLQVLEAPGSPPAAGITKYYQFKKTVIKLALHFQVK